MTLQEALDFYHIDTLWHFTDKSNLHTIKKYGILSLNLIEDVGLEVSCFGADTLSHNLDRHYGLDKYVHLSFVKEHPMCYVKQQNGLIPNPVWIAIKASVLFGSNALFSTDVANKTGVPNYAINQLDERADLEVLWGKTDWKDSEIKQRRMSAKRGEIMVPTMIKLNDILGVA
jgi:hypothetical protein